MNKKIPEGRINSAHYIHVMMVTIGGTFLQFILAPSTVSELPVNTFIIFITIKTFKPGIYFFGKLNIQYRKAMALRYLAASPVTLK